MKKPSISSPAGLPPETARVLKPMKETLDILTGAIGGEITKLSAFTVTDLADTADLVTVIARLNSVCSQVSILTSQINAVTARLNRSGT